MTKTKPETVYICSHKQGAEDYLILPHRNGIAVSRIVTHLVEDIFPNTGWQVEVITSMDMITGCVNWIFDSSEYYCQFLTCIGSSDQIW